MLGLLIQHPFQKKHTQAREKLQGSNLLEAVLKFKPFLQLNNWHVISNSDCKFIILDLFAIFMKSNALDIVVEIYTLGI